MPLLLELTFSLTELEDAATAELETGVFVAELEVGSTFVPELEFGVICGAVGVELLSQAFQKNVVKASKNFFQDLFIMLFYSQKIASHTSLIYLFQ